MGVGIPPDLAWKCPIGANRIVAGHQLIDGGQRRLPHGTIGDAAAHRAVREREASIVVVALVVEESNAARSQRGPGIGPVESKRPDDAPPEVAHVYQLRQPGRDFEAWYPACHPEKVRVGGGVDVGALFPGMVAMDRQGRERQGLAALRWARKQADLKMAYSVE